MAAGLGVKAFIESQGTGYTTMVTVMGTPAEEGGGGKVLMIEKGAFEGVDIAILAHPCPFESVVLLQMPELFLRLIIMVRQLTLLPSPGRVSMLLMQL